MGEGLAPVVRSRLRDQRVPGSKFDSTEDPPCMFAWSTLNRTQWCGAEIWSGFQLGCRIRHLPEVLNEDALVLLQNGTLRLFSEWPKI
ncbi:hypothetical protein AVEN_173593-1 [Araneus ventricosus]|uniref:Uncharacterized protein n=1 Tax=Araneus ventricosus TaxID=182803 RepID=A0A4Y2CT22_ARAVE|nr:hypothetical protein AVEN_173593-1 [Araneus ventricosus]